MKTTLFAAALLGFTLASTSYAAADQMKKMDSMTKCDEGTMTMVMDAIKKDTDPKMAKDVKMATDQMHMADMSMKKHDMTACAKHIGMAKKDMMMK